MNDILETNLFRDVKIRINSIVEKIKSANSVAIFATADLESILSLAYLECDSNQLTELPDLSKCVSLTH